MKKNKLLLLMILILPFFLFCSKKNISDTNSQIENKQPLTENNDKTTIPGNTVKESGVTDIKNRTGTFEVYMGSYKGELLIAVKDGRFYGTLKFSNWGNGTPQPLKDLRINNDRIYFVRSITTRDELKIYGGTAFFTQEFYGIFSSDGSLVRGYYRYLGAQDNWEARRK